jgi:transposase InsO family protein
VPRCILADLVGDYRRVYQHDHRLVVEELQWTAPGLVWAVDHTQPPQPIDGVYSQVLAVRDLASGLQLAWTPVIDATADRVLVVLSTLFAMHGPPLVLKSDNGSAFLSDRWEDLLKLWRIAPLLSPPRTPRYNGACEAGIGAAKIRTAYLAARHGRAGRWTCDDLEAARQWANEHHYPWGLTAGTPAERFAARQPFAAAQRVAFLDDIQTFETQYQTEVYAENVPLTAILRALIRRRAVRRALVEHGLLLITRRSIPQPIRSLKRAKIS